MFSNQWAPAWGGDVHTAQPRREPGHLLRLLRAASRERSTRREHLPEQVPLPCLPELGDKATDNDFIYWPIPVEHLHRHCKLFVLSSWWSQITPLPNAKVEIEVTNLPFMVRLLSFGENPKDWRSLLGEPGSMRKERLKFCWNDVGRRVALGSFTSILAKTTKTTQTIAESTFPQLCLQPWWV